jgi:hypothetical protein
LRYDVVVFALVAACYRAPQDTAEDCVIGTGFVDEDGDGHGDPGAVVTLCGARLAPVDDDCYDGDATVRPGASEQCNDRDDDCDGLVDDGAPLDRTYFADLDGDGYGDHRASISACQPRPGISDQDTDCDDADPRVHPRAVELCDGRRDDCDDHAWDSDAGLATFTGASGPVDVTGDLLAPWALPEAGELVICAGEWPVELVSPWDGSEIRCHDGAVLSGDGSAAVVTSTAAGFVLANCLITGGLVGVDVSRGDAALDDVAIEANAGPGLRVLGASVTVSGGEIVANDGADGGGVFAEAGADVALVGTIIGGNAADAGGGAWLSDDSTLDATDCDFEPVNTPDDIATQSGNSYVYGGTVTVSCADGACP